MQSSGWKIIFHFNFLLASFSLFSCTDHAWFFFYGLPICPSAHFVNYVNSRVYIKYKLIPQIFLWYFLSLWLVLVNSKAGRIRTHGWKWQGCRLTPKVEKESFGCQRRGRTFTEDLLRVKYSTNCKLPSCEEGRDYYHFYLSFYSSVKTRFKDVQLPAQGDLESKKQGLDTDSSPLSSTVPASLMATALGQERWWGGAGEVVGRGRVGKGGRKWHGMLLGREPPSPRLDGATRRGKFGERPWEVPFPSETWSFCLPPSHLHGFPNLDEPQKCDAKWETRHEKPYTIWLHLYEMFRRDESIATECRLAVARGWEGDRD